MATAGHEFMLKTLLENSLSLSGQAKSRVEKFKFYMAVLTINVKMTDLLVAVAELSVPHYPRKVSRKVWRTSGTDFSNVATSILFDAFLGNP